MTILIKNVLINNGCLFIEIKYYYLYCNLVKILQKADKSILLCLVKRYKTLINQNVIIKLSSETI